MNDQRSGTADAAQNLVAHRPVHHAPLLYRLYRPREHQLRGADDEQGSRVLVRRVRLWRGHLLRRLLPVRSALERHPRKGRRTTVDRSRHDHVGGRVARIRGGGAMTPSSFWAHAMRTDSGRPSSSMRFRTWTATSISVARRSSVRERSPSPITRLNRPMVASARARFVYPDALCQAMLPFSAMSSRWRSRCVGAVSAVALGTAVERGGTTTSAPGWGSATST